MNARKSTGPEGRVSYDLNGLTADGWFARFLADSPAFRDVCEIVGDRFVGLSLLTGVRISALTVNRDMLDASIIEYTPPLVPGHDTDATTSIRSTLPEFRRNLMSWVSIVTDDAGGPHPTLRNRDPNAPFAEDDPTEIARRVGPRTMLLAALYDFRLLALYEGGGSPSSVLFEFNGRSDEMVLTAFRDLLLERVQSEPATREHKSESIDLSLVDPAEEALRSGDPGRVIELLGSWPAPLAHLMRTSEGQGMNPTVRATLARGLRILGSAFVREGRFEWGEEAFRLAAQWSPSDAETAEIFSAMGECAMLRDHPGEAIGVLRRALSLGAAPKSILPRLAKCLVLRHRYVAAMACIQDALEAGVSEAEIADTRRAAESAVQPEWRVARESLARANGES